VVEVQLPHRKHANIHTTTSNPLPSIIPHPHHPPPSEKKATTTDASRLAKTHSLKLTQLQTQLTTALKEVAEGRVQRAQWEEEKAVFVRQKRSAESEMVRVGKVHEQKMATWQVRVRGKISEWLRRRVE
jgi:hypothetical protein